MFSSLLKKMAGATVGVAVGQGYAAVKRELDEAKQEFDRKVKGIIGGSIVLGIAVGLLVAGLTLLIIAGVAGLSTVWPLWLSALVAGGGVILISVIMLAVGVKKINRNKDLRPSRAVDAASYFSHLFD